MYYASDFRRIAREALRNNWGLAIITGLVAGLLGVGSGVSFPNFQWRREYSELVSTEYGRMILTFFAGFFGFAFFYGVAVFIIGSAIQLGYIRFNRNLLDRRNAGFTDIFSRFDMFGKAFLLRLLKTVFIFLWMLLFIIPGIIASYSYAMAHYILEENPGMTALEAITCSKEMMRGNKWRLFCLHISFIGWIFLCLFTCGIGFLWLSPYTYMAEAAFFYDVSGKFKAPNGQFQQNDPYNQYNPYQQNGYQANGYQQGGYQQNGYQQGGYQQNGYQQGGHQQNGYQQGGYQQSGYQQGGHPQNGYQQGGHQQSGYQQDGHQQNGHQANRYQQSGYQQNGTQQNGNQPNGYQQNENQQNPPGSMPNVSEQPGQSSTGNPANPADPNNTTNQ